MKKGIKSAMAFALALASLPVFSVSAAEIKGDVDGDGAVTGRDAAIVSQYADGVLKMELTEEQKKTADVNGDGVIDSNDAKLISEVQTRGLFDIRNNGDDGTDRNQADVISWIITEDRIREMDPDFSFGKDLEQYRTEWLDVNLDGTVDKDDLGAALLAYCMYHMPPVEGQHGPFIGDRYYILNEHDNESYGIVTDFHWIYESIDKNVFKHFDVNGDDKLDTGDAAVILGEYAKNAAGIYSSSEETEKSDINGDGTVDVDDAALLLKIYAARAAGTF